MTVEGEFAVTYKNWSTQIHWLEMGKVTTYFFASDGINTGDKSFTMILAEVTNHWLRSHRQKVMANFDFIPGPRGLVRGVVFTDWSASLCLRNITGRMLYEYLIEHGVRTQFANAIVRTGFTLGQIQDKSAELLASKVSWLGLVGAREIKSKIPKGKGT